MRVQTSLTEDQRKFLGSYHNHTQRMMFNHASELVRNSGLPVSVVDDLVYTAYIALAERIVGDGNFADFTNSVSTKASRTGFLFIDGFVKSVIDKQVEALTQREATVSIEQEIGADLPTFGQSLMDDVLAQQFGTKTRYEEGLVTVMDLTTLPDVAVKPRNPTVQYRDRDEELFAKHGKGYSGRSHTVNSPDGHLKNYAIEMGLSRRLASRVLKYAHNHSLNVTQSMHLIREISTKPEVEASFRNTYRKEVAQQPHPYHL